MSNSFIDDVNKIVASNHIINTVGIDINILTSVQKIEKEAA